MELNKGVKKCFGVLLALFIIFGLSLNVYSDVNAARVTSILASSHYQRVNTNTNYTLIQGGSGSLPYRFLNATTSTGLLQVKQFDFSASTGQTLSGNYFSGTASFSVSAVPTQVQGFDYTGGFDCSKIKRVTFKPEQGTASNINAKVKSCSVSNLPEVPTYSINLVLSTSGSLTSVTNVTSYVIVVQSDDSSPMLSLGVPANTSTIGYYINNMDVNFTLTTDSSTQALGEINQNVTIINNNIEEHYNQENQAIDNIDNQSTSDIPNSTSQQTSSLIGVISSFISSLSGFSSTNCQLTLPFPSNLGGDTVVNVCSGKEKAPTIVAVGSSLALITVFVPLAFIVLKMIYNEIRSWTNG